MYVSYSIQKNVSGFHLMESANKSNSQVFLHFIDNVYHFGRTVIRTIRLSDVFS